jgi:P-type conjugative transfer protein TrbJ
VFGQAVLTQLNTLRQVAQQAQMIENQVQQLAYQARSVASLPLSLVRQIQNQMSTYTALLQHAKGIAFDITNAGQQFDALYQTGGLPAETLARMQAMLGQVHDAARFAVEATAVFDRICAQQTNLTDALNASAAAQGETSAIQAQTQVLGVMADQQASLQQVLAAQARVQTSWYTMQTTIADQAAQEAAGRMGTLGTWEFKPNGQTTGYVPPPVHY